MRGVIALQHICTVQNLAGAQFCLLDYLPSQPRRTIHQHRRDLAPAWPASAAPPTGRRRPWVTVFDKNRAWWAHVARQRGDDFSVDHGAQYFTASPASFHAEIHAGRRLACARRGRRGWCNIARLASGQLRNTLYVATSMSSLCRALTNSAVGNSITG